MASTARARSPCPLPAPAALLHLRAKADPWSIGEGVGPPVPPSEEGSSTCEMRAMRKKRCGVD